VARGCVLHSPLPGYREPPTLIPSGGSYWLVAAAGEELVSNGGRPGKPSTPRTSRKSCGGQGAETEADWPARKPCGSDQRSRQPRPDIARLRTPCKPALCRGKRLGRFQNLGPRPGRGVHQIGLGFFSCPDLLCSSLRRVAGAASRKWRGLRLELPECEFFLGRTQFTPASRAGRLNAGGAN